MFLDDPDFDEGIIIDRPDLVSTSRKIAEGTISVISWLLWVFTLRPLLLLLLWGLGIRAFFSHMIVQDGLHQPIIIAIGFAMIMGILLLIVLFNWYDRLLHRGKYKGRSKGIAEDTYMAAYYDIPVESIHEVRFGRRVDVWFPEDNVIELLADDKEERMRGFYNPQDIDAHFQLLDKKLGNTTIGSGA